MTTPSILFSCKAKAYLSLLLLCLSAGLSSAKASPPEKKPNVLFIVVDDLGYSDIKAFNPQSFYDTPNIDALAGQGVMFTNGYAANPVCSPSRFALLTGKHPTRGQATDWFPTKNKPARSGRFLPASFKDYLPLSETTIAEAFKQSGYHTAFLGKWHLGLSEHLWPEHQGFDVNIAGTKNGHPAAGYFSPYKNSRLKDGPKGEYLTARLTNEAIALVDQYSQQSDPFFMMLSFYTVHTPLQAPQQDVQRYQAKTQTLAHNDEFQDEEQVWPIADKREVRVKQNHPTYAAMVNQMDKQVGRLLAKLQQTGLDQNTLIVFTSDNGGLSSAEGSPTSNLPLRGGKGWLYEGGIRVPLIVRLPQMQHSGNQVNEPVTSTDLYPTLLSAANIPLLPQQHVDGVDLNPFIPSQADRKRLVTRPLYFHYPHYSNQGGFPGAAIREGNWKLIERFEDGRTHLFNLDTDIGEQTDLASKYPDRLNAMRLNLHKWYQQTQAQFLKSKNGQAPWFPKLVEE
ncbi:sulfatase [Paraglaciecola arctica]|uniref:sulfatase n=1 Tax=Paraglaciecola arctica TaxID=1128911 RepID=UPI001C065447|nr:sulfatase [Paraglaciecola arctica]MBU3005283.1 sulfatase [Paraglaciecola arctica]